MELRKKDALVMDIEQHGAFAITPNPAPLSHDARAAQMENPAWGRVFTDHMATLRYSRDKGWHDAKIEALKPLQLHASAVSLHYGVEIFEGLKAYRLPDGGAQLFRPDANARRFANSAKRLVMPELPVDLFVESVRALSQIDRDWIPTADGASLYLRPFMIGTEETFATNPSGAFLYCVAAAPVGAFFSGGAQAIKLWVCEDYTRAAIGGTGEAKCGGNYAAGLPAQAEALRQGCNQVIFLDAIERRWVEELGAMNVFFVFDDGTLQTPPLTGTILPGVTRDSIITLARDLGYQVNEAPYAMDQWMADAKSGRLVEAFSCGTAAVVAPISEIKGNNHNFQIGDGTPGAITTRIKTALTDIQFGRAPDPHGWCQRLF